jgi:hypothetical protein
LVDGTALCGDIFLGEPRDLAFAEPVHGFIALDRLLCRGKHPEPFSKIHAMFHTPMILPHDSIPALAAPGRAGG